ncbi:MAG: TIGR02186 family protein [Marinosulfonomonas sp.]|nr:TIGR02186 family protein [Marinosulfonomonas sp.]
MLRILIVLLALTAPAFGEEVVAGLSQNRVAITANFDGSEILVFGAVKRDAPAPVTGEMHVIVTVSGPSKPVTVRRKEHRYGIWMNTDSVVVDAAPSFYSIATSAPLADILLDTEDLRHRISIPRAIRLVGAPDDISDAASFTEALIRIKTKKDLYQLKPETVIMDEETLFKTQIALPANLTEGAYITRIFLTRNGQVVDAYETTIAVQKVGLERWLYNLAHEKPLIYGILSLVIAIAAGWGASAVFRYLRP